MNKLFLLGLGQVGTSLLNLIQKENLFDISDIFILDKSMDSLPAFIRFGGTADRYIQLNIESGNYLRLFDHVKAGDHLVDLANGLDNYLLSEYCLAHGIHYLSTCDDSFIGDFDCFTFDLHYDRYSALRATPGATSIVQIGMNPGLVNIFTKRAIRDIVENDTGAFVSENREKLKQLLSEGKFAETARLLEVTEFIESDLDLTETSVREDPHTVYSTWNVPDYDIEINERSIVKLGTLQSLEEICSVFGVEPSEIYYYSKRNGTLVFDKPAIRVRRNVFTPLGYTTAPTVSHEELFSIHGYYSIRDDEGELAYAPSVSFSYQPCELAIRSVMEHQDNRDYRLITKDVMSAGGEVVGIIAKGKNFAPRYVGNYLEYGDTGFETPTVMQVSIGTLAALKYIRNHPEEGLLYPENTDDNEMLAYALPYLKKIISCEV